MKILQKLSFNYHQIRTLSVLAVFMLIHVIYEPRCEKTGLQGFRPGPTQTGHVQPQKMTRGLKFQN